jgi:hypothetical protein
MALTQDQWYEKMKSWVPAWWFEQEKYNVAVFKAIAEVMSQVESDLEAHQGETFIAQAAGQFLDAHGDERSVERDSGELDALYSGRVRNMVSVANAPAIKSLVDALLLVGSCTIREHMYDSLFMSRDSFYSRREVYTSIFYDAFTIVVSNQGVGAAADTMMAALARAVDEAKALGTLYRVTETLT